MPDRKPLGTHQQLNAINREFYRSSAEAFSEKRQRPWPGWARLLSEVPTLTRPTRPLDRPLSVLDVGCGNGRFGLYLARELSLNIHYYGLDASQPALALAEGRLKTTPAITRYSLVEHDLVTTSESDILPARAGTHHDLIVLFGLMHHIPGRARRAALLEACAKRLRSGGFLALTRWRFAQHERFKKRIVPWEDATGYEDLDRGELEPGDALLSWGDGSQVRYCHAVSEEEADGWSNLANLANLDQVAQFDSDGESGDLNRYLLFRRP